MKPGGWLCLIGEKGAWLSLWDTGMGVGGGEWMDLLVMGWQRGSGWADGWGLVTWMTGLWVMGGW